MSVVLAVDLDSTPDSTLRLAHLLNAVVELVCGAHTARRIIIIGDHPRPKEGGGDGEEVQPANLHALHTMQRRGGGGRGGVFQMVLWLVLACRDVAQRSR